MLWGITMLHLCLNEQEQNSVYLEDKEPFAENEQQTILLHAPCDPGALQSNTGTIRHREHSLSPTTQRSNQTHSAGQRPLLPELSHTGPLLCQLKN